MGSCVPFADEEPFSERVKNLKNQDLLEIWEETQQIENLLRSEIQAEISLAPDYEQTNIDELRLRSSRQCLSAAPPKGCPNS